MGLISKEILTNREASEKLEAGIQKLSEIVGVTLGPKGRYVLIDKKIGSPHATKDGVTVAREVYLQDDAEAKGADMIKEAAKKTGTEAGDGTTTATVLAARLVHLGFANVKRGENPVVVARAIESLGKKACEWIQKNLSQPLKNVEECINVATIAANNDRVLGELIGKAVYSVGSTTPIIVDQSFSKNSTSEKIEGYMYNNGIRDAVFFNDPSKGVWSGNNLHVLIVQKPLGTDLELRELIQARCGTLDGKIRGDNRPILIIAAEMAKMVESFLIVNARAHPTYAYQIGVANPPRYGEEQMAILEDIAILTNATIVTTANSAEGRPIPQKFLGEAESAKVSKDATILTCKGASERPEFRAHVTNLRNMANEAKQPEIKKFYRERADLLEQGTIKLHIGGDTEMGVKEKIDRVDDAIQASRCALDGGIVPGGGIALLRAYVGVIKDENLTPLENNLGTALLEPFLQIMRNAGIDEKLAQEATNPINDNLAIGVNPLLETPNGKVVGVDLMEANIIDPTKVVCTALEKACSVASLILTTGGIIIDHTDLEAYNKAYMSTIARSSASKGEY